MEEVRSYWQVASITHFCNLFGKPFKLPTFEPEELEQAFIIDVPEPPKNITNNQNNSNQNHHVINNNHVKSPTNDIETTQNKDRLDNDTNDREVDGDGDDRPLSSNDESQTEEKVQNGGDELNGDIKKEVVDKEGEDEEDDEEGEPEEEEDDQGDSRDRRRRCNDPLFKPPPSLLNYQPVQQPEPQPDEPEMHLLVKLGIALLKPHFNSKLTPTNWENYLYRLIDLYWVELEHHPSPFRVPIITPEGVELTKNLTFNELPLSDKIDLIYALCDYRFWCEDASDLIKDYTIDDLRLESIGKDSQGFEYWYFMGTRLFKEDKELSQDLILRKKRIKELEYKLIELEKARIFREQEEKRKAEIERAKQLAIEAKEARLNAKKRQNEAADNVSGGNGRKKRNNTPILPPRTGLRERRSSAASNNNDSQLTPRTTRSKVARQSTTSTTEQQPEPQSAQKTTRSSSKQNSKETKQETKTKTPEPPKRPPIEECKEEMEKIAVSSEDRAAAWCIQCESLEEWESFAIKFEKTKSTNEKYLSNYINQEIMPRIRAIYGKRAAEARRKEKELILSLASRRVSSRIISKRAQEEEEERLAKIREAELQKKKAEAEMRLRAELEQEVRAKRIRERAAAAEAAAAAAAAAALAPPVVTNGGSNSATCSDDGGLDSETNGRYNLRQQAQPQQHLNNVHHQQQFNQEQLLDYYDGSHDFDGIIHPDKLSEFYEALELIIDTVKTSKHAWPFVDPVPETVPGYYDLIDQPMDLKKLRTKVEFREYKSLIELEKDFQLLVNNCEKFNGPKNVYTKMVYKLWKSFRKNVVLYLQRDLHMDEFETFIYPPPVPVVQIAPQATTTTSSTKCATKDEAVAQNGIQKSHTPEDQGDTNLAHNDVSHQNGVVKNEPVVENNIMKDEHYNTNVKPDERCQNSELVNETKPEITSNSHHYFAKIDTTPTTTLPDLSKDQEAPMEVIDEEFFLEQPPEPVVEEVIIDSVPCQEETFFVWAQDGNTVAQQDQ